MSAIYLMNKDYYFCFQSLLKSATDCCQTESQIQQRSTMPMRTVRKWLKDVWGATHEAILKPFPKPKTVSELKVAPEKTLSNFPQVQLTKMSREIVCLTEVREGWRNTFLAFFSIQKHAFPVSIRCYRVCRIWSLLQWSNRTSVYVCRTAVKIGASRPDFQGHSRSSERTPIDRQLNFLLVTMIPSRTLSEKKGDFCRKSQNFPTSVFKASADGVHLGIL